MRVLLALLLLAGAASCDVSFFGKDSDIPTGFICGEGSACPPGQRCVPGENVCRRPCSTPSPDCNVSGGSSSDGSCGCPNNTGMGEVCDVDLFCRPGCNSGGGGGGGQPSCSMASCPMSQTCDGHICRPACGSTCGSGFTCSSISNANGGGTCSLCLPIAASMPGDGGAGDGGVGDGGVGDGGVGDGGTGSTFVVQQGTAAALQVAWGADTNSFFVAGDNGTILRSPNTGTIWSSQIMPGAPNLDGMWGTGSANIYVAGAGGYIAHFDGVSWTQVTLSPNLPVNLHRVWGIDGGHVWVVGDFGVIWRYDGSAWTQQQPSSAQGHTLWDVWSGDTMNVYAVGLNSTVLLSKDGGISWSSIPAPPTTLSNGNLRGLWGFPGAPGLSPELWVVGEGGGIFYMPSGSMIWMDVRPQTSGTTYERVWGDSPTDVWVVGGGGTLLHTINRGMTWDQVDTGTTQDLHSLWGIGGGGPLRLVLAGDQGTILLGP